MTLEEQFATFDSGNTALIDKPQGNVFTDPMNATPRNNELTHLNSDELEAIQEVPSIPKAEVRQASKGERAFRVNFSSLVNNTMGALGTQAFVIGKKIADASYSYPDGTKPFTVEKAQGEFIRDIGLAMTEKGEEWKKAILGDMAEASTYGEQLTEALASAPSSIATMAGVGWLSGRAVTAVATRLGAPPLFAAGAGGVASFIGGFTASKAMSYQSLFENFRGAGYSFEDADAQADVWSLPIAALDYVGLHAITNRAINPLISLAQTKFSAGAMKSLALKSVAEGLLTEGMTEAAQGVIEDQAYIMGGVKEFNLTNYMASRSVEFLAGAISGGGVSGVGVGIQLRARTRMIDKLQKELEISRPTAKSIVDDYILEANKLTFDIIQDYSGTSESVENINKAFLKLQGQEVPTVNDPVSVESTVNTVEALLKSEGLPADDPKALESRLKNLTLQQAALDEEISKQASNPDLASMKYKDVAGRLTEEELAELKEEYIQSTVGVSDSSRSNGVQSRDYGAHPKFTQKGFISWISGEGATKGYDEATYLALVNKARGEQKLTTEGVVDEDMQMTQALDALIERAIALQDKVDALTVGTEQVKGNVKVTASYLRSQAAAVIKSKLAGFKLGVKASKADIFAIQKAFKQLIKGVKLPSRGLKKLLFQVLSTRPEKFNLRIPAIAESINQILEAEQASKWADFGKRIIDEMQTKSVDPDTQRLAAHLAKVVSGKHPGDLYAADSSDPATMVKYAMEQAALAINEEGSLASVQHAVRVLMLDLNDRAEKTARLKASQEAYYANLIQTTKDELKKKEPKNTPTDLARIINKHINDTKARIIHRPGMAAAYSESFKAILETIGPKTAEALNNDIPDSAHIVGVNRGLGLLDNKIVQIYGKDFQKIWVQYRTKAFVSVPITGKAEPGEMTRAGAMSLWIMLKNAKVREQFLKNNSISEEWVRRFEAQDIGVFSAQDFEFMASVEQMFKTYYELVSPVYEQLTGSPLGYENFYFPTFRYMMDEEKVDTNKLLDDLMNGTWTTSDETDKSVFKKRSRSDNAYIVPDIFKTTAKYVNDMEHFLAYAVYTTKLKAVFNDPAVKQQISKSIGEGWMDLIGGRGPSDYGFIDMYMGKTVAGIDGKLGGKLLGLFSRNLLATPKQFIRQLTGMAAATELPGIGAIELGQAAYDLPRAWKSGELKDFINSSYMKKRMAGAFDQMARFLEEQTTNEVLNDLGNPVLGKAQQILFSRRFHQLLTLAAKSGDTVSSVVVGWAAYKQAIAKGETKAKALFAAQQAVNTTQQSLFTGDRPLAFHKKDIPNRLLTLFSSTTSIYFDRYRRTMRKAFPNGPQNWAKSIEALRIGKSEVKTDQVIRTMLTYHVWIPLFEFLFANGIPDEEDDWKVLGLYSALGPFGYHLLLGQTIAAIGSAAYAGFIPEAEIPPFMQEAAKNNLLCAATQRMVKAIKKVGDWIEYPDYETGWEAAKAAGGVADIVIPTAYPMRIGEGIFNMLSDNEEDFARGIGLTAGFSEAFVDKK